MEDDLKIQIANLVKALEFYACPWNYDPRFITQSDQLIIYKDHGSIAREALKNLRDKKDEN